MLGPQTIVGVCGAGAMGVGIPKVAAQARHVGEGDTLFPGNTNMAA